MRAHRRTALLTLLVMLWSAACSSGAATDALPATTPAATPEHHVTRGPTERTPPPTPPATTPAQATTTPTGPVPSLSPSEPFTVSDITLAGPDRRVTVPVYVADDGQLRQRGLMGRASLPAGTGMIFVFEDEHRGGFWMKDTLIPLSIAFLAADGAVLAVLDMEPCTEIPCPVYNPGVAYRYALEVNQGFFDDIGLDQGWTAELGALADP